MSRPYITVIVAFYNVDAYAQSCIRSLIHQTSTDYELILIDDGSTDSTGAILDQYRECEGIRVFHKANGGLSDARNYGVERARGEYIAFVDGDDVVSPYFIEGLSSPAMEGKNVVVIGDLRIVSASEDCEKVVWDKPCVKEVLDRDQAIESLCRDLITESSCAKLFPADILKRHLFPVGLYFEDLYTIGERLLDVERVVTLSCPVYGYVMREGSIVRSSTINYKRIDDYLEALEHLAKTLRDSSLLNEDEFIYRRLLTYARIMVLIPAVGDDLGRAADTERMIRRYVASNIRKIIKSKGLNFSQKIRYLLMCASPEIYRFFLSVYNRLAKGVS